MEHRSPRSDGEVRTGTSRRVLSFTVNACTFLHFLPHLHTRKRQVFTRPYDPAPALRDVWLLDSEVSDLKKKKPTPKSANSAFARQLKKNIFRPNFPALRFARALSSGYISRTKRELRSYPGTGSNRSGTEAQAVRG